MEEEEEEEEKRRRCSRVHVHVQPSAESHQRVGRRGIVGRTRTHLWTSAGGGDSALQQVGVEIPAFCPRTALVRGGRRTNPSQHTVRTGSSSCGPEVCVRPSCCIPCPSNQFSSLASTAVVGDLRSLLYQVRSIHSTAPNTQHPTPSTQHPKLGPTQTSGPLK